MPQSGNILLGGGEVGFIRSTGWHNPTGRLSRHNHGGRSRRGAPFRDSQLCQPASEQARVTARSPVPQRDFNGTFFSGTFLDGLMISIDGRPRDLAYGSH